MRKLFIGICLLLVCNFAWCGSKNAWENLSTLQPGDKVQVIETDQKKVSGAFESVNDDGITLYEKNGKATIDRSDVLRVRVGDSACGTYSSGSESAQALEQDSELPPIQQSAKAVR